MKIDLPLSGVGNPVDLVEEDIESIKHSYTLSTRMIREIYEGLKPFGVFVDSSRVLDSLTIRPKDVSGSKSWSAAFGFVVYLSNGIGSGSTEFCRLSVMNRMIGGWEVTVFAGSLLHHREFNERHVVEKNFGKTAVKLIRELDQGSRLLRSKRRKPSSK